MILEKLYINGARVDSRDSPLPWQIAGLTYTASGYGRRIPTHYMVQFADVAGTSIRENATVNPAPFALKLHHVVGWDASAIPAGRVYGHGARL